MLDRSHEDLTYVPTAGKLRTLLIFIAACAVLLVYAKASSGEWFPLPPPSMIHCLGLVLPLTLPLLALNYGWTYALRGNAFVALRFGNEKLRLPLHEFQSSTAPLGMMRLHFRSRSVFLVSSVEGSRQAFLAELHRRARLGGVAMPGPASSTQRIEQVDAESVRIPVALIRWPHHCISCAQPASTTHALTAKRGYTFVMSSFYQYVTLPAPVCALHKKHRRWATIAAWLMPIPLTLLIAIVLGTTISGGVLTGILILSSLGAVVLSRLLAQLFGAPFLDGLALGTSFTHLSSDLTVVTLRARHAPTLQHVLTARDDDMPQVAAASASLSLH